MNKTTKARGYTPPWACVPNNRPEVVLTVTDFDHTWTMRTERTIVSIVIIIMMGRRIGIKGGIRWVVL